MDAEISQVMDTCPHCGFGRSGYSGMPACRQTWSGDPSARPSFTNCLLAPPAKSLPKGESDFYKRTTETRKAYLNQVAPLVNSSFQALDDCPCGGGTPELAVIDGFVHFACMTRSARQKSCRRITPGVPSSKGARWRAAAQWNEMIANNNDEAALALHAQLEREAHTVIPDEEEWLERHWSRRMGLNTIQRKHKR